MNKHSGISEIANQSLHKEKKTSFRYTGSS